MILDLAPVIARLNANLVGFKSIGGSADLDLAIDAAPATPSAFVLPLAESAVATDMTGRTYQRVTQRFGVMLCQANRRDAKGVAALDDLHVLRQQVRNSLVGWAADPAIGEPVHFVAGRLMKMDGDGRLWWIDEFELALHIWSA